MPNYQELAILEAKLQENRFDLALRARRQMILDDLEEIKLAQVELEPEALEALEAFSKKYQCKLRFLHKLMEEAATKSNGNKSS